MENKMSYSDFTQFVRELKKLIDVQKVSISIANETMQRVAINNEFNPIYLW